MSKSDKKLVGSAVSAKAGRVHDTIQHGLLAAFHGQSNYDRRP